MSAQNLILNGSFENNLGGCTNASNHKYDSLMANSYSFGSYGDLDIFKTTDGCGAAENGMWYIALTSGGTDAFSLELFPSLVLGNRYSVTFIIVQRLAMTLMVRH